MFEYGYETTRKCTTRSTPAIDARAWPKSTCAVPGAHASRAYPSDSARCRSRHRLTQRCTDGYEPSNPCSSRNRCHTRMAVCRCLRGSPGSAADHPSTISAYPESINVRPALPAGRGEKSSLEAYFTTVVRDTCSSRAIRAWLMPCPSNCPVRCCTGIDVVNPFPPGNLENGYQHPGIYQETGRHRCPIPQPTTPSKMNATTVQKK